MLTKEDFEFRKTYCANNGGTMVACGIRPLARRMIPVGFDTLSSQMQDVEDEALRAAWEHAYGDLRNRLAQARQQMMLATNDQRTAAVIDQCMSEILRDLEVQTMIDWHAD